MLVILVIVLTLFLYWTYRRYSHWTKRGIPGPTPLPIVGNLWRNIIGQASAGEIITEVYNKYTDYPFVGVYRSTTPILLVRDPDFIKNILVKDFKNFHDNDVDVDPEVDEIFGRNPFVMKGAAWKHKRAQLTTCFTSGKIKGMHYFLDNTAKRMVRYIEDELKHSEPLEAREVCVRFTLDNVAACAFGLEGKSFDEPYSNFRELADNLLSPEGMANKIMWMAVTVFPQLISYFKIRILPKKIEMRLLDIVKGSLKYREENNIVRNDFLDIIKNQTNQDGTSSTIDILANAVSFFGDGYETSSRVMAFLLYELALNPEPQAKLRQHLTESFKKNNNQFTYESVNELQYLDACLSESLRLHSVVYFLTKVCTEDYTYSATNPDFKPMTVNMKVGDAVMLPIVGLQMDPKYFEDPDVFKPERFIDNTVNKYTYFPFGEGPRACLGQRFALTQIKVGVAYLIKNFKLTVNSKTRLPLTFDPYYIMKHPIGGLWLNFEKVY